MPFALDDDSEPEPDVVVVRGQIRDYRYGRAGVADYWIVNLRDRVLEVHRAPRRCARTDGPRYARTTLLRPPAIVTPLAAPDAQIPVADLLP